MPNQVKVFDEIQFMGGAKHRSNMGPMQPKGLYLFDHFDGHTVDTVQRWTTTHIGAGDGIAINAEAGGWLRMTTSTTDNASLMIASALNYEDDLYCKCEARIRLSDVSIAALYFGFSDANTEATPQIAMDGETSSGFHADADNAAGFVVDADYNTSGIYCASVATTTKTTPVDSGTDWADGIIHILRVELDPDGKAYYYLDGNGVGYIDSALTSGTDLCVTVQGATRAGTTSSSIDVDYIWAWQELFGGSLTR